MLTPQNGICNEQYLLVTGTIWPLGFKRLCGINPDQHFYVHLNDVGNFEHIDFAVTTVHSNRPYKFGESMIVNLFFLVEVDEAVTDLAIFGLEGLLLLISLSSSSILIQVLDPCTLTS